MFALVRDLAAGRDVSEIAVDPDVVQRHLLGPLAARHGVLAHRDDLVRSTLAWKQIEAALPKIVAELRRAGAQVAPIKGVAYATSLYQVAVERPMTDVDLLVPPSAVEAAERVLARLGFACEPRRPLHHATTWVRGSLVIDLHRGFVGAGRSRIDHDSVWARAVPGWPEGASRLEPVDELAFHLLHMSRNRLCGPLIHVVDAARLIARMPGGDPAPALRRAQEWQLARPVKLALRYCRDVLRGRDRPGGWLGPSPGDVLAARQPSALRKVAFDLATAGSARQLAARAVAFALSRR